MSESNKHTDLFINSGCLNAEALKRYNSDSLSHLEKDQVQVHLDSCELCSDALEGLQLMTDTGKLDSIVSEINENLEKALPKSDSKKSIVFKKQTRIYYYAAAASIVILMGFYFYLQNDFKEKPIVQSISQVVDLNEKSIPPMPKAKFEKTGSIPEGTLQQDEIEFKPTQEKRLKKQMPKEKKIQIAESDQSLAQEKEELDIAYVQPLKAVRAPEDIPKLLGNQDRITQVEETIEPKKYTSVDIASTHPIEYYIGGVIVYDKAIEKLSIVSSSARSNTKSRKVSQPKSQDIETQSIASESKKAMGDDVMENAFNQGQGKVENESELRDENHFFSLGNEVPQFPGGYEALIEYLMSNLHYPKEAKQLGLEGQVVVSFLIEENGEVSSATIIKGIGGGCNEEALRVIILMPSWEPAYKDGNPIKVLFNMPITFKLN